MLVRTKIAASALLCSVLAVGCDDPVDPTPDAALIDAGEVADAGADAGPAGPDVCDTLSLSRAPFQPGGTTTAAGALAGDFTVTTLEGTYQFSTRWSGCESYVFFVYFPDLRATPSGDWQGDILFASYLDQLFLEGPQNVRYFFTSFEEDAGDRLARMEDLRARLDEGLASTVTEESERAFWRERFHFVTDRITDVEGSIGAYVRDYMAYLGTPESIEDLGERGRAQAPLPYVFGIDRAQTFDPGGNLSPAVGRNPQLGMAAFLGHYYEHRFALDARLAAETDVTVVSLLDETTTGRVFTREVTLPDASAMAAFDSLEVDVEIICDERNPFACSEWDRIADIQLCAHGAACTERREIARWITPYWRRGRQHWAIDASPFLALLRAGGATSFFVELGPEWERATEWTARVSLRLRTRGGEARAMGAEPAFRGGAFGATYNDRMPVSFTPPAEATRVELVTILSGHGQESGNNCAEWCDHRHTFSVNGASLPPIAHEGPSIGSARGCAALASEGVLPGQWGNWAQSRAYWCPGLPVEAGRTDITSMVRLGEVNELTYAGSFGTSAPAGGDIALSSYVVWYLD